MRSAVKHFRHTRTGKRRLHQTPDRSEIRARRPWLVAEFARLRPKAVVVLGATAAKALLGPDFRVTRSRAGPVQPVQPPVQPGHVLGGQRVIGDQLRRAGVAGPRRHRRNMTVTEPSAMPPRSRCSNRMADTIGGAPSTGWEAGRRRW